MAGKGPKRSAEAVNSPQPDKRGKDLAGDQDAGDSNTHHTLAELHKVLLELMEDVKASRLDQAVIRKAQAQDSKVMADMGSALKQSETRNDERHQRQEQRSHAIEQRMAILEANLQKHQTSADQPAAWARPQAARQAEPLLREEHSRSSLPNQRWPPGQHQHQQHQQQQQEQQQTAAQSPYAEYRDDS